MRTDGRREDREISPSIAGDGSVEYRLSCSWQHSNAVFSLLQGMSMHTLSDGLNRPHVWLLVLSWYVPSALREEWLSCKDNGSANSGSSSLTRVVTSFLILVAVASLVFSPRTPDKFRALLMERAALLASIVIPSNERNMGADSPLLPSFLSQVCDAIAEASYITVARG